VTARSFDFGAIAHRYDQWFQKPPGSVFARLERRALERCIPRCSPGDTLLDAGCGTGYWTALLAGRGFAVTGIDISREMLAAARQKAIPHASFLLADMMDMPFPDESFDAAASITALEFADDPRHAVSEMVRCVKPGGAILIAVLNKSTPTARRRRRKGSEIFKTAHLFSTKELYELLKHLQNVSVKATAFVLPYRGLLWTHGITDFVGNALNMKWGDFIIGRATR